ncbi:hypothetical protein BDY21DRAFT_332552 [Lineolata rhizophorae]|uniref:Uncharacterized protein n=1 Tax=Lineolata rhizophorae TaxID=578093 RepID=A0A6A6PCK7_9PEZI|nr:hypothetical protein BDY21DRAFT_332552 [Lineolata rhizophorae]
MGTDLRRRGDGGADTDDEDEVGASDEDWDVEAAVENRVVQVSFTVPRNNRLRVVNAEVDRVSLVSREDEAEREREREREMETEMKGDMVGEGKGEGVTGESVKAQV